MKNTIKLVKQLIKVTPVLKRKVDKPKIIVHTYSGEYFPLYKNEQTRVKNINEYQTYD
jgi:hypothetical protein